MDFLVTLIYFVLGLSFLVLVHELGHFLFAKLFNVYVFEFSIGMGPVIKQVKKGESKYSIRALPVGGYVLMAGENITDEAYTDTYIDKDTNEKRTVEIDIPFNRTINGINNLKKFLIISAGVIFNFILCFILLMIVFMVDGAPSYASNHIRVTSNSVAEKKGLKYDDFVISIKGVLYNDTNKTTILTTFAEQKYGSYYINDLGEYVNENNQVVSSDKRVVKPKEQQLLYTDVLNDISTNAVKGNYACLTFKVKRTPTTPIDVCYEITQETLTQGPKLGLNLGTKRLNLLEAAKHSFGVETKLSALIFETVGSIFTNYQQVGGPIAIFQVVGSTAKEGFFYYLYLLALISANLAVVNLMPFPGLDGGRLLIILGESITRKKFPPKTEAIINAIGMYLLFGLLIAITLKDIIGLF